MQRVIVNEGTKVNLYQLFEDLQNYIQANSKVVLDQLFESFGINALTTISGLIDPSDTSLKVTGAQLANYVSIGAGDAITETYCHLNISPGFTTSLSSLADGDHTLYLQNLMTYDTPIDVVSGFAYGIAGTNTKNSRAHDSTAVVWDIDPTISGICLVDLTTTGGVLDGMIVDRRVENVLKFNDKILGRYIHTQGTDTGTMASTFRVGNSTAVSNDGVLVALQSDVPMPPKNIRIVDVTSPTLSPIRSKEYDAAVSVKWNYDNLIGVGSASNTFIIGTDIDSTNVWQLNELVGYHLYISYTGLDYLITANDDTGTTGNGVTTLTVLPYKHTTDIIGMHGTGTRPASIHSNCNEYELVIIPVLDTGEEVISERYEDFATLHQGLCVMQSTVNLFLGEKVIVKIRAVTGTSVSDYSEMAAGIYTKLYPYTTIQQYDKPFLVQLPTIDSTGAKIGANSTTNGFTITIVGWDIATDFEICYTTDASGPDFMNSTHEKITTRQRSVDVVASGSRVYQVAVRPLISGQAVADAKTTTVTSGTGGNLPQGNAYPITNISFKTYSGTITTYNEADYGWSISGLVSPAGAIFGSTLDTSITGSIMTIDSIDYLLADTIDNQTIVITTLDGGTVFVTGFDGKAFSINTSKAARTLAIITNFPIDSQLTAVAVEQWVSNIRGPQFPTVLRWYQQDMENYADYMSLNTPGNANYYQTTDVTVLAANGNNTLIVDLWDPTEEDNVSGFYGNITIYWKAYIPTGRRTDNIIAHAGDSPGA
jgi:hypothetical protein